MQAAIAAVLAALRERRAQLDVAIAALEALADAPPVGPASDGKGMRERTIAP